MSAIVKDLKINARYDLRSPDVIIYYEQANSINRARDVQSAYSMRINGDPG